MNSPNNGHFGTWASVLYSGSVLYWGVLIKPLPHGLNNAFDTLDSTITHFNNILAGMHNMRAIAMPGLWNRALQSILLLTGRGQIRYVIDVEEAW